MTAASKSPMKKISRHSSCCAGPRGGLGCLDHAGATGPTDAAALLASRNRCAGQPSGSSAQRLALAKNDPRQDRCGAGNEGVPGTTHSISYQGSRRERGGGHPVATQTGTHLRFGAFQWTSNDAALLVGFQFWGGKSGHDLAVARLRDELSRGGPAPEIARENYNGVEIASSKHQGFTLYNASQGQWGFLSNNLAVPQGRHRSRRGPKERQTVSRTARATKKFWANSHRSGSCSCSASLRARWKPCWRSALPSERNPIPQQVEQLRKVEAIGATTKLDEANLRDTIFVLRRNPPDVGSLNHAPMKFTSQETAAYFDFATDFRQILAAVSNAIEAGVPSASRHAKQPRLCQLIPEAFGPDCAISVSWAPQQMRPSGLIAIQIRDQAKGGGVPAASCLPSFRRRA